MTLPTPVQSNAAAVRRTVSVAATAKWDAKTALQRKPRMTKEALFIEGNISRDAETGKVTAIPTPVQSIIAELSHDVVGVKLVTADAITDDSTRYSANWYLRSNQDAYYVNGKLVRDRVKGFGLSFVVQQNIEGVRVDTLVRMDQTIDILRGTNSVTRGKVPIQNVRTISQLAQDEDGPLMNEDGQPYFVDVQLKPFDDVTGIPTWEQLQGMTVPIGEHRYYVTDLLTNECARRKAKYAANHSGEVLDLMPIDCLEFSVACNHQFGIDSRARFNDEGNIVGEVHPGDIPANTGDWFKRNAGVAIGVRGGGTMAWFQFISIYDLAKAICGTAPKLHFVPTRTKVGQEKVSYRSNSSAALPTPASQQLVAVGGVDDLPF